MYECFHFINHYKTCLDGFKVFLMEFLALFS